MKYRHPLAVLFLPFITLGIYHIVWFFKTREELLDLGCSVPTAWLSIIPVVHIYWMWVFAQAAEEATGGRTSAVAYFVFLFFLGPVGQAIMQNDFNKVAASPIDEIRITVEEVRV